MSILDALFGQQNNGQQAQAPGAMQQQPGFLSQLLDPSVALPMAGALLGNQGNAANLGNAFSAAGPAMAQRRELQAQTAQKNKTLEFLRQNAPEYADAVDAGMPVNEAWRGYTEARKAQTNQFQDRAAAAQQYGLDPNSPEGRNFILSGDLPTARGGAMETGLVPQMMRNEKGETIYVQATKDGRLIRSDVPEGFQPYDPYSKAFQTSSGTAAGKGQGEAAFDLPRVEQNAAQTLGVLNRMKTHPGRAGSTGFIEGMLPSRSSDQVDFQSLIDQTQGQSFLQAFQMLKGGGQITEVEGQKATDAISRLRNQRLSDADYVRAITDLEDVITAGLARARQQAGQGGGYQGGPPPQGGGNRTQSGVSWSVEP